MSKIKKRNDNNKVKFPNEPKSGCGQCENDILFEFEHITSNKRYSYNALIEKSKTDTTILKKYIELINTISVSTWAELSTINKKTIGGFETKCISDFHYKIWDNYNGDLSNDTKLYIFRFGNKDKYRMVGYKSPNCKRVIHILGFDLDFSLYDHG